MPKSAIVVVKDKPASEVARAMIESGFQKEPFYIFYCDAVSMCVEKFRENLPRVKIFYAMKSNDDSMMLKIAIALGLGFDCASPGEINKIRKHNVRPTSIIYAAPMKTPEQMIFARKSGVKHTTFDSFCELSRLKQHWPDSRLLIRVKVISDSIYKLGDKFGCEYSEAVRLLDEAGRLGMNVVGVAFHVGSACFSKQSYSQGLEIARELFDHEAQKGRKMILLDIGGGFLNNNSFDQPMGHFSTYYKYRQRYKMPKSAIVVVKDKPASEVARAMIESGFQKEPFYIFYCDAVSMCVEKFRENLPRVKIFYAMKSNDDSMMLKIAIALGLGFDCASPGEINKIRKHNVRPTSIIYAAPMKTPEQMIFARKSGVKHTTFDSFCELSRLKQHWPDSRLLIRVKVISDSIYKLGDKFGCEYSEAVRLLDEAGRLGMNVVGVAFHVGSACFSKQSYSQGLEIARELFDHEAQKGRKMILLDIGGGFLNNNSFDQPMGHFSTYYKYRQRYKMPKSAIVVVKDKPASEVARAMIESGFQKEPFYIFYCDAVSMCVEKFRENLPRVKIFYAMKSNDDSMMLKIAIALGLGFDCASPGEINKIRKHNVRPTSIIYAAPMKTPEQMIFARKSGVKHTTFDSFCELSRLKQHWPDSRLLIRVKVISDSIYKLGDKFGCEYSEAVRLLDEAGRLGMNVVGVAFHVGSACFSKQSYSQGLEIARELFDHEAQKGRKMILLDIGGGFLNNNSFDQVAAIINSGLARWFPDPEVQVIAEPGRYICESAFTLYTNIRAVRTMTDSNNKLNMVYLNNGINGLLRFFESWHTINQFKRTQDIGLTKDVPQDTIIWGPTMDNSDFLEPVKLALTSVDDWLVVSSQGAYCKAFSSEYCCMEQVFTRSVMSEELWAALKKNSVFPSNKFVIESEIPLILPSTLPPIVFNDGNYIMSSDRYEGFKTRVTPAYVLDRHSPDDVARAMIERGDQEQPFYIFNMDEAYCRIQHFKDMLPRVKIFYAVKSNDTDMMLRLAVALGLGFDCASPGEIHKIRKLNVNPSKIVYAMPCKTTEEMEYARKVGVKLTTFDSAYELKKITQSWPDARLLLRIRIDGTAKKRLGLKFGCDFEEATSLLDEAARLGLHVAGVAFHVGSICYSPESYVLGLQQARTLFDYEAKNGRKMDIVDIGGGFLSDKTDNIDEVSYLINDALDELFPDPTVQIIAEPGRYLSDSAFKMFCSIIGVRQVVRDNSTVNMIYLNNGVYGTMRYDENWHKLYKFQRSAEEEPILKQEIILWGPTCDSFDRVMQEYKIRLPQCSPNDWLVIDIHGAYTFTYSTRFSNIELPLIRSVVSKELWSRIKTSYVFQQSDFVLNPDISAPLPSSLPSILPACDIYEHSKIPTLTE